MPDPYDIQTIIDQYKQEEGLKSETIRTYVYDARANYEKLDREAADGLSIRGERDWAAVNHRSRIKAVECLLPGLDAIPSVDRQKFKLVRTVVLTSRNWLVELPHAHEFEVAEISSEVRDRFAGLNYIGVVEPGLYPRWHELGEDVRPMVSWHVHLIFWVKDVEGLERAVNNHCEQHHGTLIGVRSATVMRRSWKTAAKWLSYFLKTPAKSYSKRRVPTRASGVTGELILEHDRQLAQKLRPGEMIKMCNVLRAMRLDDLVLAGGQGAEVAESFLARAAVRSLSRAQSKL